MPNQIKPVARYLLAKVAIRHFQHFYQTTFVHEIIEKFLSTKAKLISNTYFDFSQPQRGNRLRFV
jgi:hypothetical protein